MHFLLNFAVKTHVICVKLNFWTQIVFTKNLTTVVDRAMNEISVNPLQYFTKR